MGRPGLRLLAASLLSALLLALALRDVEPGRLAVAIGQARPGPLLLALALDAAVFTVKAAKWRFVYASVGRLPLRSFFGAIAVGALASTVVPLRLDEVARAAWLARGAAVRRSVVLGTIVVERLLDAIVLLGGCGVVLLALGGHGRLPAEAAVPLAALAAGAACALALVARGADLAPWVRRVPRFGEALASRVQGLNEGLAAFPRRARLLAVFGFGVAEWTVTALAMQSVLAAFGVSLPWAGDLALVAASYLSFALPSAPGAIGVFEYVVKATLAAGYALPAAQALAVALVLHALLLVPISLLGALVLARAGVGPWRLARLDGEA